MSTKALTIGIAAVLVAGIAIITITAGGEHGDSADPRETDGAFIVEMTSHHESAIEMAKVAEKRAEHPEVKQLAAAIVSTQAGEIDQLSKIHTQLFGLPVSQGKHGTLGLGEHQMGMSADMAMLEGEKPFDRAFIDRWFPITRERSEWLGSSWRAAKTRNSWASPRPSSTLSRERSKK